MIYEYGGFSFASGICFFRFIYLDSENLYVDEKDE